MALINSYTPEVLSAVVGVLGQSMKKHPRFYFTDGTVIFLVEETLYNIHRYFFQRDSPVFEAMFSLPTPLDQRPEGEIDDEPIVLDGVETVDFDRFLSILYPANFLSCEIKTVEEWTSVLNLASLWEFNTIRDLSIERLRGIASPVDKIILGHRYDLPAWLEPAYTTLCERRDPLTLEEGHRLGTYDIISIGQVRHAIRYPANLNRERPSIVELVNKIFLGK